MKKIIALIFPLGILLYTGCEDHVHFPKAKQYPADVAIAWINLQQKLVKKTAGYNPGVTSRLHLSKPALENATIISLAPASWVTKIFTARFTERIRYQIGIGMTCILPCLLLRALHLLDIKCFP